MNDLCKREPEESVNGYVRKGNFIQAPSGGWIPTEKDMLCALFNGLFTMWADMYVTVNKKPIPENYDKIVDTALQQLFLIADIPWVFPADMEKYYLAVKAIVNTTRNALTIYGGKYIDWRFYAVYPSKTRKNDCRKEIIAACKQFDLMSLSDPRYTKASFGEIISLVDTIGS